MKKFLYSSLALVMATGLFSCTQDSAGPATTTTTIDSIKYVEPVLSANMDGTPTAFVGSLNLNYNYGRIIIEGVGPVSGISILIPVPTDTVTYESFGSSVNAYIDTAATNDSLQYTILVGTPLIRITSYNSVNAIFSGTFSFTLKSLKGKQEVVTNGVFSNF